MSIAGVENEHNDSERSKFIILQFYRSEVNMDLIGLKSRGQDGSSPSEGRSLEATPIPWLLAPSSFKVKCVSSLASPL